MGRQALHTPNYHQIYSAFRIPAHLGRAVEPDLSLVQLDTGVRIRFDLTLTC